MWLALFILLVTSLLMYIRTTSYASVARSLYRFRQRHLPTPAFILRHRAKRDVLKLRSLLRATNAQDQFARWAKIRRRLDAKTQEYDGLTHDVVMHRGMWLMKVGIALRVLRYVVPVLVWYFWWNEYIWKAPEGWFSPLEGLVQWPAKTHDRGAVGILVWWICCEQVTKMGFKMMAVWDKEWSKVAASSDAKPTTASVPST